MTWSTREDMFFCQMESVSLFNNKKKYDEVLIENISYAGMFKSQISTSIGCRNSAWDKSVFNDRSRFSARIRLFITPLANMEARTPSPQIRHKDTWKRGCVVFIKSCKKYVIWRLEMFYWGTHLKEYRKYFPRSTYWSQSDFESVAGLWFL